MLNDSMLLKPKFFLGFMLSLVMIYLAVDFPLAHWISAHLGFLKPINHFIYIVFNGVIILPLSGFLVLLAMKIQSLKSWRQLLQELFAALFLAQMILVVGKILVGRARPYQALIQGYQSFEPLHLNQAFFSFPSGHTFNIMLIAGFLSLTFPSKARLIIGLGLFLSFFRVLGLDHFLSDWLLTAYLAWLVMIFIESLFKSKRNHS